jgi:hypothetical protein
MKATVSASGSAVDADSDAEVTAKAVDKRAEATEAESAGPGTSEGDERLAFRPRVVFALLSFS